MKMILSQERNLPAIAAFAVGIAVTSLMQTPFGLLAPIVALFLFANGRARVVLHTASATGLVGSLLVAASYQGEAREVAATWAAFFALAICIGALVATRRSAQPGAEARPVSIRSTTRDQAQSYPIVGPSLEEKAAPRSIPVVSIVDSDDAATAVLFLAVSFWGGLPFHLRYWRRQPDGRYRWVETRSEPLPEPSGTRHWRVSTAEIDEQSTGVPLPTKTASNPPNDDDAVRAAKFVEVLLGNAWAFDAAGRPTYLTPFAQTLVAVTLDEFQAAVDEGHTFFKRTAHPDDYDSISEAWRRSLQTGEPFFLDRRIRRASGIHEWNRTGFVPTRDSQGRITGWYGSTIDLDSHRIAQAELRERERELSQLVDMVPSHLWRLTPDGEPVFFNKRMVDFLGFDIADADKRGVSRLDAVIEAIHPDDATEFRDALTGGLAKGETFAIRYRLRRADNVYRWMDFRAEALRGQNSAIVQWYVLSLDVDDEMRTQRALQEREREFKLLIDMVPSHVWRLSTEGEPTFYNRRLRDFLGFDVSHADKPGLTRLQAAISDIVHPEDVTNTEEAIAHSLATGVPFSIRHRARRADGVYRWLEVRGEPLRDDAGAILQWYGVNVDIDDSVRLSREVEEREARIRRLVDSDIIGIIQWDLNGTIIDSNDAFLRMVQYNREELKAGLDWFAMTPPDWQEVHASQEAEELARTGRMLAREKEYFRKDGSRVPVLIGAASFEGQPNRGVAYILDLTEQKRVEEALHDRERELSQLVDLVPVQIRRLTPQGEPIFFNKRLMDFFGLSDMSELDKPGMSRLAAAIQGLVHAEDTDRLSSKARASFASGEPFSIKYRMRRADGAYRWVDTRGEPLRNQAGSIVQWYVISLDIDDEMRAQAELRRTQERLAHSSQAASLAELSASIAHEVNQPLAAVVANSHACQRWLTAHPPNLERAQTTVERIIRDANGAADVVARIRALFKQNLITRSGSSLSAVIAEAERAVSDLVMRYGVVLDVGVEPGVPPVAVDQVQVQQVLVNLMRNAVEAMATSPGDRLLTVRGLREGDTVRIEVCDTGAGIKDAEKIFDAFFTTKENGMGMGLAVSRSIVESHGGRLWAEQNGDGGANFIFTLPIEASVTA